MICTHLHKKNDLSGAIYVAESADIMGDVTLGEGSSVWFQTVLRADISPIRIGKCSNIQDGTVIHMASDRGTVVGDYVTVGHKALLHACEIGNEVLVGMGAIIMDGAVIGDQSIIAAGALVTKHMTIPSGSLVMGSPAKVTRALNDEERASIKGWAEKYVKVATEHAAKAGG